MLWVAILGRFIQGLGSGVVSFVITLFIGEMFPGYAGKFMYTLSTGAGLFTGLDLALLVAHKWKHLFKYGFWPLGI